MLQLGISNALYAPCPLVLSHVRMITLINSYKSHHDRYCVCNGMLIVRYTYLSFSVHFCSVTFYFMNIMISCTHVHHFRPSCPFFDKSLPSPVQVSAIFCTSLCHFLYVSATSCTSLCHIYHKSLPSSVQVSATLSLH